MKKNKLTNDKIQKLVSEIAHTYQGDSGINFIDASNLSARDKILNILDLLIEVFFPGYTGKRTVTKSNINFIVGDVLCRVYSDLCEQVERAYQHACRIKKCDGCDCQTMAKGVTQHLLTQLPKIRGLLKGDVSAVFERIPSKELVEIRIEQFEKTSTGKIKRGVYIQLENK